jgi:hypothetical protein
MAIACYSCKECGSSDPTQDTVKVDVSRLVATQDKENIRNMQVNIKHNQVRLDDEAERLLWAEKEAKETRKAEEEARRKREETEAIAAAAAEERRLQEEAAKLREQVAAAAAAAEEERAKQEALRAVEEAAKQEALRATEDAAKKEAHLAESAAEEQRLRLEDKKRLAQTKVNSWCKENGYQSITAPKKTFKGNTKFVLHTAVKHQSLEMVGMLLMCGAKKDVKDSKGHTPLQLAENIKSDTLRGQIIDALNWTMPLN